MVEEMHSSSWLAGFSLPVPPHQALAASPSCPGTPSSGRPSRAGAPGTGRRPVPAPGGLIPAGIREETKPREAGKKIPSPLCQKGRGRLQVPSCRQVDGGQPRPRLADARYLPRSRGAAGLGGHITWVPTHSSTAISGGARNHPISSPFFFYPFLPSPPSTSPTARGLRTSSPLNPPLALQLFWRKAGGIFSAAGSQEKL